MKKIFHLQHEKHHPNRVIESIKSELRKYLKRERKKKLTDSEKMYWDFDCKFGRDSDSAVVMSFDEILKSLDKASYEKLESCYIEIMVKMVMKPQKEKVEILESLKE
jgi:phosphoenolpyruvate synthase/pyruvate phosphate dikinase